MPFCPLLSTVPGFRNPRKFTVSALPPPFRAPPNRSVNRLSIGVERPFPRKFIAAATLALAAATSALAAANAVAAHYLLVP